MRIVSLLPSATEIVAALGLAEQLVGRSEECDWPPQVRDLPVVTSAKVSSAELASAEIDQAVRDTLLEGSSLYALDEGLVRELRPDLVITQDLCSVCAVSGEDVRRMERLDCDVLSLDPRTVGEVELSVWQIADRAGVCGSAEAVVSRMRRTIWDAASAVEGRPRRRGGGLQWARPPLARGPPAPGGGGTGRGAGWSPGRGSPRRSHAATGLRRWSTWPAVPSSSARRACRPGRSAGTTCAAPSRSCSCSPPAGSTPSEPPARPSTSTFRSRLSPWMQTPTSPVPRPAWPTGWPSWPTSSTLTPPRIPVCRRAGSPPPRPEELPPAQAPVSGSVSGSESRPPERPN